MLKDAKKAARNFADTCIRCGKCAKTNCGNYGAGINLGDICESILKGKEENRHFPFTCALCNRCTVECPVNLKAIDASKPLRAIILENHPELRSLYRHFRTDKKYNLFSIMQARHDGDVLNWKYHIEKNNVNNSNSLAKKTAFFPGCSLASYGPKLVEKAFQWLNDNGQANHLLRLCCGAPFFDSGFFDEFENYKKSFCDFLVEKNIERLIIACPHCNYELKYLLSCIPENYPQIEIVRLTTLLSESNIFPKLNNNVNSLTIHDACYDRDTSYFGDETRQLLKNLAEEKPMEAERQKTLCCGGGGMVSAYSREYCEYRRNIRLSQIDATEADCCISTCFSCVNSMQRSADCTSVKHYLELIFDVDIDWNKVYASVDDLYNDAKTAELLSSDEMLFD